MALHLVGPPVAYPLKTLEQLADPSSVDYSSLKASVPLARAIKPDRPRLLVCHDFKGGYQDDKWIQGNSNEDAYSLWHWDLIDVFVYFSHDLVTLPPPCWTNAAHKHGVQVLGTFITEGREGAELCRILLQSPESVEIYASRLAELAHGLGFDGWLLNIENPIAGYHLALLLDFIQLLTGMMHSIVPGSLVIWYDAVTIQGDLIWQNCLNRLNKPFFDVCDGIFTNYSWTTDSPRDSAKAAGDRAFDVYMGVDVFGRNTFGGGGFQSDRALQVARASGVSAALFAPGWVYETGQGPNFHSAQDRWWGTIKSCWPRARKNPISLPFFSNFDQGVGNSVCTGGQQVSNSPWSNLSCQNLQVLVDSLPNHINKCLKVFVSQHEKVYSGGSCLKITGKLPFDDLAIINLYHSSLEVPGGPLHVSYSVALKPNSQLSLALEVEYTSGRKVTWFLCEPRLPKMSLVQGEHDLGFVVKMPDHSTGSLVGNDGVGDGTLWTLRDYVLDMGACHIRHLHALIHAENSHHIALRNKYLDIMNAPSVSEASTSGPEVEALATTEEGEPYPKLGSEIFYTGLLGHLRVSTWAQADCNIAGFSCDFGIRQPAWAPTDEMGSVLTIELFWKFGEQKDLATGHHHGPCHLEHCKVYGWDDLHSKPEFPLGDPSYARFLGVSEVNSYFVDHFETRQGCTTVWFAIQRFCVCGGWEDLTHAPKLAVAVVSR